MSEAPPLVDRIDAVLRIVPDLDEAECFYRAALDGERDGADAEAPAETMALLGAPSARLHQRRMRIGLQHIALARCDPPGRPYPADSTSSDLWFQHCAIVVDDMDRAFDRVMKAGAEPISEGGPMHLPANAGGVTAFKFRDPFGHPWELLAFADGTAHPAWRPPQASLFKGIDHTAIAVSSGAASRRFYADVLGLALIDRSHNEGPEQSGLDDVANDVVGVTALGPRRAPPHLELLAYEAGTRRSLECGAPTDAARTYTLATGDHRAIARALNGQGDAYSLTRAGSWFGTPALLFEDPDGHAWICSSAEAQT